MGGIQQMIQQQQRQASAVTSQKAVVSSQLSDDMDAVGDMELDEPVGRMDLDDGQRTPQLPQQVFGQMRPQLQLNSPGLGHAALRTPTPTTPAGPNFSYGNNPTVSSVNTPTLTTHQGFPQRGVSQFPEALASGTTDVSAQMGNVGLAGQWAAGLGLGGASGLDPSCIDDPAKRLTGPPDGQLTAAQQQLLSEQLGLVDLTQLPPGTDAAALVQTMMAMTAPEEHKPYKCPVIGCEKAYKNQNGLKWVWILDDIGMNYTDHSFRYHRQHSHQKQKLQQNEDGSFSILNPETSSPYPGTLGMEKEKPFKCDICGKRYKNLNGLKYVSYLTSAVVLLFIYTTNWISQHKQHSPQCNPENIEMVTKHQKIITSLLGQNMGLQKPSESIAGGVAGQGLGQAVGFGQSGGFNFGQLPNIGEEHNMQWAPLSIASAVPISHLGDRCFWTTATLPSFIPFHVKKPNIQKHRLSSFERVAFAVEKSPLSLF
jgi:transcription factor SFP1